MISAPPHLTDLLASGEWNSTEFKAARDALPKSVFETVSAFANTQGGWLVLGVSQQGEQWEITGVSHTDKLQNDLLSVLHAGAKVNHDVLVSYGNQGHTVGVRPAQSCRKTSLSHLLRFARSCRSGALAAIARRRSPGYAPQLQPKSAKGLASYEALLNAVVHRSYTDPSDIQIKIFDDRITLFSPGGFYGGISVADIQADNYRSSLRNKLVAEGFYLTRAIEKYGSGFIRIRKALEDYPEVDFNVQEFAGGVMVTFARQQPESQPESSLPLEARILLLLIKTPMGKRDISEVLGQKEISGQLNKVVRALLAADQVELTLPGKPTSRLQQYRLTEAGRQWLAATMHKPAGA